MKTEGNIADEPCNVGIKSVRATLSDKIFYWGFCFLNKYMREKPNNATIINLVY
jgi:hypothetical protein